MKLIKRAAILAGIFLAAVGVYLVVTWNHADEAETVYTFMEAPSLPVVFAEMENGEANRLAGYRQEMRSSVARDSLVILPEDRKLPLQIREYGAAPLSVSYDIRSLDGGRLIERTQLDDWTSLDGVSDVTLPIQNLIAQGTEYLLHIRLETELHGELHYYTRILWPEEDHASEMMALAREFSVKCLDEAEAASLVTYLETTDTADNSSLGDVTLKSSFSQLTWAGLEMTPVGDMQVTLREMDGIMGQVCVTYQVSRLSEEGVTELYDTEDYYTMRWDEKRIYLMDLKRTVNQVFAGRPDEWSGKRIILGVGTDEAVKRARSENGRFLAYVFNRDLWLYDQNNSTAVKLFSFRTESDDTGRSGYDRHDIEILSVGDTGDVDFLVYGYMNRGVHEGYQGISICHYDQNSRGAIEEGFFVPSRDSFDELKRNVRKLCCLSSQRMLYLFLDQTVFGIDLTSDEYMVVARDLADGAYAVSSDQTRLAWQDEQQASGTEIIHLLNLETGVKQEITAPADTVLRTLGFVQGDFVYGMAQAGDTWLLNGRPEEMPMYAIQIVDDTLKNQSSYTPADLYIANVSVEEARIHLDRLVKTGDHVYEYHDSDTIVCNTASDEVYMEGIGWYASETRRKVYFIQLDKDVDASRGARVSVARRISCDNSVMLTLASDGVESGMLFYAYGRGRLQGVYTEFSQAAHAVYDIMGIVTDRDQRILWDRVNRANLRTLKEPQTLAFELTRYLGSFSGGLETQDGLVLLDGRGLTLRETLYFIGKGYPVIAYTSGDRYVLLYGYDQYNVSVLDPETGERRKMGLNDGTEYFEACGNDFVCGIQIP